jgi:hypothetical protein
MIKFKEFLTEVFDSPWSMNYAEDITNAMKEHIAERIKMKISQMLKHTN